MAGFNGSVSNAGNQIVSIYPTQELNSKLGNEILAGVIKEGVANASISLSGVGGTLTVTIKKGTTLFFKRSVPDPDTILPIDMVVKIILGQNLDITKPITTLQSPSFNAPLSSKAYIVADIDATYTTNKYAQFLICSESQMSAFTFTGNTHQILVASLLNFTQFQSTGTATDIHVGYECQPNKDTLTKLYNKNENFTVFFSGSGTGVYISKGNTFSGNALISTATVTNGYTAYTANPSFPFNSDVSSLITVPLAINNYYSPVYGNYIDVVVTGTTSLYYQIDFLRMKNNEVTHTLSAVWESFLQPMGTFTSLNTKSTQEIINYLSGFNFPLTGNGITLLASVRLRSDAIVISTHLMWPETCVNFIENNIIMEAPVNSHSRFKLPVYSASDLGLS